MKVDPRKASKTDTAIGERIRERREVMGITQSYLGEKLGITFQQVQKYENGVNRVSAGRLVDVARILEVPIEHFFSGLGKEEYTSYSLAQKIPRKETEAQAKNRILMMRDTELLVRAFNKIKDPSIRRNFIKLVRDFSAGY